MSTASCWTNVLRKTLDGSPILSEAGRVLIVSDYSASKQSPVQTYSYLVVDPRQLGAWTQKCRSIRRVCGLGEQAIDYKSMRGKQRTSALASFLDAADSLHGLLLVVAVKNDVVSLFDRVRPSEWHKEMPDGAAWKPVVAERLFRVGTFGGSALDACCRLFSDVDWVSDNDEIAANSDQLELASRWLGVVTSVELSKHLGHFRFGTIKSQNGQHRLVFRDLISVADLAAGGVMASFDRDATAFSAPRGLMLPQPRSSPIKSHYIMSWLGDQRGMLRKRLLMVDRTSGDKAIRCRRYVVITDRSKEPMFTGDEYKDSMFGWGS